MPLFQALRGKKQLVVLDAGSHAPLERAAYEQLTECIARFLSASLA